MSLQETASVVLAQVGGDLSSLTGLLPIVLMFVYFVFFVLIRPQ